MRLLPLLLLLLTACPQATRTARFLGPPAYRLPDTPHGELATVHVSTGLPHDEPHQPYVPQVHRYDEQAYRGPVWLTSRGAIHLTPRHDDVHLAVYTRSDGLAPSDWQPFVVATGALADHLPLQLQPLPRTLDEPLDLPMAWAHNVYRNADFDDGDLLLIELSDAERTEHYLFRTRRIGWRTKAGVGLLVRMPLPELTADPLAPALAATLAVGYRPNTLAPLPAWAGDKLALVVSLGIGTTRLPVADDPLGRQLSSVYDAALGGGGIELYDIVSLQVLANLSALGRDADETGATLAVGFDAVQFGRFSRDAGARLFRRNALATD